ncbi:MAG: hypothetical protein ACOY9D_08635 [Pseudomonadota bacterium]
MFNFCAGEADVNEQGRINLSKGAVKTRAFGLVALAVFLCSSFQPAYADGNDGHKKKGKKQFVAINNAIVEVQGAIASLQDQLNSLVARVSTLEERVTADEVAIGTLQSQNQALQALAAQNLTDITAIQNEVLTLQSQNTYLQSLIAANSGNITTLQAEFDANSALITTLQQAILLVQTNVIDLSTSLQAQINDNMVLITALQGEIDMIRSDLAFRDKLLGGICPNGQAATAIQADGSLVCASVGSGGGATQLTQFSVYQIATIAPGANSGNIITGCPAGSVATDSGIAGADRVKINRMYTLGNVAPDNGGPLTLSSAVLRVINTDNSLPTNVYHVVNCIQYSAVAP